MRAALTGSGAGPSPAGSVPAAHISAAAAASPPSNCAVPFPADDSKHVRQRLRLERCHTAAVLAADLVQALKLLQLRAQLDAVVLLALQSFLQALSLLPLNTQTVLQTKSESRCGHT